MIKGAIERRLASARGVLKEKIIVREVKTKNIPFLDQTSSRLLGLKGALSLLLPFQYTFWFQCCVHAVCPSQPAPNRYTV